MYIIFLGPQLHCDIIKLVIIKIWDEIICF